MQTTFATRITFLALAVLTTMALLGSIGAVADEQHAAVVSAAQQASHRVASRPSCDGDA